MAADMAADSVRMTVRRKLALTVSALLLLSGASTVLSARARQRTTVALAELQAGQQRLQRLLSLDRELQLRWRELSVMRELSPTPGQVAVLRARLGALDGLAVEGGALPRHDTAAQVSAFAAAYAPLSQSWRSTLTALDRRSMTIRVQEPAAALDALLAWRTREQAASAEDARRFAAALAAADRITMALLGFSCLVGTGIVVALSFTLAAGFARLDDASRHVANGDYAFRLPDTGRGDEFERAARTFNDMAAALAVSMEETRAARSRAEQASAAKSGFLTSLCHDLKTPLTAILGYADTIEYDVQHAGLVTPTADIRQLRRSARVLLGMVGELLDYARLEVGRMPIALDSVDPAALVGEVSATLHPLMEQRGNTFRLTDRAARRVTTDQGKVRHILLNLLGNACKFTSNGCIEVELGPHPTRAGITLEVRDSGIGMTAEEAARVFAPYVQANSGIAHRYGGSGLGLAISKQFAELLDGDIIVSSSPEAGTTFVLTLPDLGNEVHEGLEPHDLEEAVALFAAIDQGKRLSA